MEKLINFIESRYNMARDYHIGNHAGISTMLNQAFGLWSSTIGRALTSLKSANVYGMKNGIINF